MARNFASASLERVDWTPAAYLTSTMSVAFWVRYTTLPSSGNFMGSWSFGRSSGADHRDFCIDLSNTGGTYTYRMVWTSGGSYIVHEGTVTPSTATWYHVCATVDWTQNPDVVSLYVDGASVSTSLTFGSNNGTPDAVGTPVGAWGCLFTNGAASIHLNGDIAEGGMWSAVLTAGEALALSKGLSPILVRPASIINYAPFLGGINDRVFGPLNDVNTTSNAEHPPLIMRPRRRQIFMPAGAAPPGPTAQSGSGYNRFRRPFGNPFHRPF